MKRLLLLLPLLALPFPLACSDSASSKSDAGVTPADGGTDPDAGDSFATGAQLKVPVGTSRVYVKLADPPAIVTPAGDGKTDTTWDLAFEGLDVFTNSGPSGSGSGQAFGPLDAIVFIGDTAPEAPFLTSDQTGGAFLRWYFYEGAPNHALDSRYHIYGVRDGAKTYKVQIITYYGDLNGAPTSARYHVRWADVDGGAVHDVADIDGTANGKTTDNDDVPTDCLDLGTAVKTPLTAAQARASSAWHLCFRRQSISVNGEQGGPRGVGAIDLDADKTATETLVQVANKTPESEQARFDATNAASFAGLTFRGDRIVSAFTDLWIERGSNPPAPRKDAWLVVGANGTSNYLVGFAGFEGATTTSPGTVVMRVKPVK